MSVLCKAALLALIGGTAAVEEGPAPLRVFVDELKTDDDAPPGLGELSAKLVTAALSEEDTLQVVSLDDAQELLALESQRQATGCGEESACLSNLARALEADLLISGTVGLVDDVLTLSLSALDSADVRVVGRETVRARDLYDLSQRVPAAVRNLLADELGRERVALPPPDLGRRVDDASSLWTSAAAGGAAAAGAAALMVVPSAIAFGLYFLLPGLYPCVPTLACFGAPCAAAGAATAASWLGDLLADERSLLRAFSVGATGLVAGGAGLPLAFTGVVVGAAGGVVVDIVGNGRKSFQDADLSAATVPGWVGLVGGSLVVAVLVGAVSALAYVIAVGLSGPDPMDVDGRAANLAPPPRAPRLARGEMRY